MSLAAKSADNPAAALNDNEIKEYLLRRGLLWLSLDGRNLYCSNAGVLLMAKDPTVVFPQSCIRLLAFKDKERDPKPADFLDVSAPVPKVLDRALQFIDKNTRHPLRVVGVRRLRLDEYPVDALREAIINAMVHRDYEDASRRIHIELFKDRIEVSSPGLLPGGVPLAQLRSGKVHPCSRNPVLAQGLRLLGLMEEMGTGVLRMKQTMLEHGLKAPEYAIRNRCLVVTFRGPGDRIERLQVPHGLSNQGIAPSLEDRLNARQKKILIKVARASFVTSGWCRNQFKIAYDTANRDLLQLQEFGLLRREGRGRSTKFTLTEPGEPLR